jgi:hypothetical protein
VLDETLDLGEARFDSIALSGVLPCLPATMNQKTAALSRLRPYLADDGVLFGSTILGRGVRHNGLTRRVIAVYNRKGIFTNLDDDLEGHEQGLAAGSADVDVQTGGIGHDVHGAAVARSTSLLSTRQPEGYRNHAR